MKESKDRTEQFMHSTAAAANQAPSSARLQLDLLLIPDCMYQNPCSSPVNNDKIQWVTVRHCGMIRKAKVARNTAEIC
jgi:hypothetical protein